MWWSTKILSFFLLGTLSVSAFSAEPNAESLKKLDALLTSRLPPFSEMQIDGKPKDYYVNRYWDVQSTWFTTFNFSEGVTLSGVNDRVFPHSYPTARVLFLFTMKTDEILRRQIRESALWVHETAVAEVTAQIRAAERRNVTQLDKVMKTLNSGVIEQIKNQVRDELRQELIDSGLLKPKEPKK